MQEGGENSRHLTGRGGLSRPFLLANRIDGAPLCLGMLCGDRGSREGGQDLFGLRVAPSVPPSAHHR